MSVSVISLIEQVRIDQKAQLLRQVSESGSLSEDDLQALTSSLLAPLSNRGPAQLPALHSLLPLLQASPSLCSTQCSRLLPPLLTLSSRPGAPSSLLCALLPVLELLVRHSVSQSDTGKQVSAAVPSLLSCLLPLLREGEAARGQAVVLLITLMDRYPGSCGSARTKIETALVSQLGTGLGAALLGKAFSLLPQLGGGGKEGADHTAQYTRLLTSVVATLHSGLDTMLQNVKEFQQYKSTAALLPLSPCSGPVLQRASSLTRQLTDLSSVLGQLVTRGFPQPRVIPVDSLLGLATRLLSLPPSSSSTLSLLLPLLTSSSLSLLSSLVTACKDLLLPEAASVNSLLLSGLQHCTHHGVRSCLHSLLSVWCDTAGAACGLELCAVQLLPLLLQDMTPKKQEMQLSAVAGGKKKGKKGKSGGGGGGGGGGTAPAPSDSCSSPLLPSSLASLSSLLTAVGPWLPPDIHTTAASLSLSLALGPSPPPPSLLSSLSPSPHLSPASLSFPALHRAALQPSTAQAASAALASLTATLHTGRHSLEVRATPLLGAREVQENLLRLEQEHGQEVGEEESSTQTEGGQEVQELAAARDRIQELEKELETVRRAGAKEQKEQEQGPVKQKTALASPPPPKKRPAEDCDEDVTVLKKNKVEEIVLKTKKSEKNKVEDTDDNVALKPIEAEPVLQLKPVMKLDKPLAVETSRKPPANATEAAGKQLTVEEMLKDFSDKLSDNLIKKGAGQKLASSAADSDSD